MNADSSQNVTQLLNAWRADDTMLRSKNTKTRLRSKRGDGVEKISLNENALIPQSQSSQLSLLDDYNILQRLIRRKQKHGSTMQ